MLWKIAASEGQSAISDDDKEKPKSTIMEHHLHQIPAGSLQDGPLQTQTEVRILQPQETKKCWLPVRIGVTEINR